MHHKIPTYSSAWIGAPPDMKTGGVPGHDVFGFLEMAKANTTNPLFFWCLDAHVPHYQKEFKDYPNVKVMSIEKFLNCFPEGSPMAERAQKVKEIKEILLNPKRNRTNDRVVFKDTFFLFLLYAFSGWMGDSNLMPMRGKEVALPWLNKIHMPHVSEEKNSDVRLEDLESWLLFSPEPLDKTAKKLFDRYCFYFFEREKILFEKQGYSEKYYQTGIDCFFIPALQLIKKERINLFQGKLSNSRASVNIDQYNLKKNYFNTHKFDKSSFFDKDKKSLTNVSPDEVYSETFYAIYDNDDVLLEDLLSRGMDINRQMNVKEAYGETALHYAIKNNKVNAVRISLKYNPNLKLYVQYEEFDKKMTPYKLALALKNPEIISLFNNYFKKKFEETKENKMPFLTFFGLDRAMAPEKVVRTFYRFSVNHRKEHPEDAEMLESFKKELMEAYRKIKYTDDESSSEYKGYIMRREDFLSKYGNIKISDLFKNFRQNVKNKQYGK